MPLGPPRSDGHNVDINYWVVKGRPSQNDFEAFLKPGELDRWYTGRPPKRWSEGDRVFFWRGSPACEIVGLGEFCGLTGEVDDQGKHTFEVRYETSVLRTPIAAEMLKADPLVGTASFLKSGPSGTVFPISMEQARRMYEVVGDANRDAKHVWSDLRENHRRR